jgi:HAD superfamily hydrolase (TIGR01509 family)
VSRARIELVIFDCDGVLVDSEVITSRVFAGMLNELGLRVTLEDMFAKFVGRSIGQCLQTIESLLGRAVPEGFVERYNARIAVALKSDLKAVPGVEAALNCIQVPYCVASSGTHEKMQMTLGITGLISKFRGRLFSVTEVARPKPFPDVFLHAANSFGVAPAACAVIEDTPTGVAAGVAAGMTVFGFCARTAKHELQHAGAQFTFDNMNALPDLLFGAA